MKPRLNIQQKLTAFTNIYSIYETNEAGKNTQRLAYAQQKRLAFKEKVTFYTDDQKSEVAFTFRAEKVMDVHGRYFVEDASGACIGMFKKEFAKSLLSSTWKIMDADGKELFVIKESNMAVAVARRFIGALPGVGDLLDLLMNFIKYHFVIIDVKTNEQVGKHQKVALFRDYYTMSMTDEAFGAIDWRVFAAMGVGLDALQSR
jgi:uncharacterized protein YxjI